MSKGNRKCACGLVPAACKESCGKVGTEDCHELSLKESIEALTATGQLTLPEAERTMREAVLSDAKQAVCSDRNTEYGEPIDNMRRWAGCANALGYRGPGGRELSPHDMPVLMVLGKAARTVVSPDKADTWVDGAGYFAIGYECVLEEYS